MQSIIPLLKSIIIFFSISAVLVSCSSGNAKLPETSPAVPKLPVDVITVHAQTIEQSEVIAGSVVPIREIEVMSELSRKVTHIGFTDGSFVRQGQLLYKLDDADILAKIR